MVSIRDLISAKPSFKSAVRAVSLKSLTGNGQSIQGAENHAKRLDPISQKRRDFKKDIQDFKDEQYSELY